MKRWRRRYRVLVWGAVITAISLILGMGTAIGLPWAFLHQTQRITRNGDLSRMIKLPGEGHSYVVAYRKGVWDYYYAQMNGPIVSKNASLDGAEWAALLIDTIAESKTIEEPYVCRGPGEPELEASFYASGWPRRCFYSGVVSLDNDGPISETLVECGSSCWPCTPGDVLLGPLLLNTAVFSVAWGGVLVSPFLVSLARRRIRSRNSQCPECGYDRMGIVADAVCPECGKVS